MNKEKVIQVIPEILEHKIDIVNEILENQIQVEKEDIILKVYDADKYEGEYEIVPLAFEQQELNTKNKLLEQNLIIKEVPYFETSNKEGTTIYIASEV